MRVRARFLGSRIESRSEASIDAGLPAPAVEKVGQRGIVMLFRFGAMVAFDLTDDEESAYLRNLGPRVRDRFANPETEAFQIEIDPAVAEQVDSRGRIVLREPSIERLQVVAHALAKSVVLAHYEQRVAVVMARVEEFAAQLRTGKSSARLTDLLQEIGDVLLIRAKTVGRAEVGEKPDITWEFPDLESLYERLASELELRERDVALSRKLELVSTTAKLYLDLLQTRKGIRVEWYIVALIVVEIVLILYDMFIAG